MPLSEHEQKMLADIERHLFEEDPRFAEQVSSASVRRRLGRRLKIASAVFVAGLCLLLTFAVNVALGIVGFALMVGGAVVVVDTVRRLVGRRGEAKPQAKRANPLVDWWAATEARWRERWEHRQ
ncbi:MAG: DUF3040 domain-containing protein [Actinomycetota bacterium]